jgi:hypothetical protein
MNILLQEKNDILENHNTATASLMEFLYNLDKSIDELNITIPLSGSLDLGVLVKNGFDKIKTIRFLEKGKITDIIGYPSILEILDCHDQFISDLLNLPSNLIELNASGNIMLNAISLDKLSNLKKLNISDNSIENLDNLPTSLIELICSKNMIRKLNLNGLDDLKILDVRGNKNIILESVPSSIIDMKIDNNPFIELNYASDTNDIDDKHNLVDNTIKINYKDALNDYFKMKKKYQDNKHNQLKMLYYKYIGTIPETNERTPNMVKKIARKMAKKSLPKCISCMRPVGTVFKTIETKPNETKHVAYCGDTVSPCRLKIELYNGQLYNIHKQLYEYYEDLNELKCNIIQQKLDNLFNYMSNDIAIKKFKNTLNIINFENIEFNELLQKNKELNENEERSIMIKKKKEIIYNIIQSIKVLIDQYNLNNDRNLLNTAMNIHVKELVPELRNLFLLKNEVNEVELISINSQYAGTASNVSGSLLENTNIERNNTISNTGTNLKDSGNDDSKVDRNLNVLIQKYSALHKMEDYIGEQPKVVHYRK